MRRQIGEKSLSIWLEILSIADRNESELPGDYEELIRSIAGKCQATVRTVSLVFDYAKSRLWFESEPTLRVAKYWKYHRLQEQNKTPTGNRKSSLPSEPSEPSLPNKSKILYPSGFQPSETIIALARERQWPSPDSELEAFRDYHTARGSRMLNWDAAFRTWLRNAKRMNGDGKRPAKGKIEQARQRTEEILKRGL